MAIEKIVYVDGVTIIRAEQLNAWQDELIDLANRKAGALIDTASGAIASIVPDSTIDNLLGVTVDVEPVQDLHGYDVPWPGGGGKNLFNKDAPGKQAGYALDYNTGNTYQTSSGNYSVSDFIPVVAGQNYIASGNKKATDYCWYDSGKTFIIGGGDINTAKTAPSNAAFLRIDYWKADENAVQLEAGSAATSYAPYENLCPISGWDAVEVGLSDEQYFDPTATVIGRNWIGGAAADRAVNEFPVNGGETLTLYANQAVVDTFSQVLAIQMQGSTQIINQTIVSGLNTLSLRNNCDRVIIQFAKNGDIAASDFDGTVISVSERINTYTIALGQTVYGGKLGATAGKMTVDRAILTLRSNMPRYASQVLGNGYERVYYRFSLLGIQQPAKGGLFSHGVYLENYTQESGHFYTTSTDFIVFLPTDGQTVASYLDAQEQAGHPVQICYPLAAPIEIQLDPVAIATIAGQTNNVWADAGDVSVEFAADIKAYIDSKIAAAVAALS